MASTFSTALPGGLARLPQPAHARHCTAHCSLRHPLRRLRPLLAPQPWRCRRACGVCRAEAADSSKDMSLAPVKPKSPVGEMLAYYYKQQPHLFKEALRTQFLRIKELREQEQDAQETPAPPPADKSELVLYRRMEDLKRAEQRATVEDLMYASIVEKFMELGVDLLPRIEAFAIPETPVDLKALTEGVHSKEALEVVKEHVMGVMGQASMAFSNTQLRMSKLQAAQVYMASIMFGYFVRRVDKRFQLERRVGTLEMQPDADTVARLERMFSQASAIEEVDNPDAAPPASPPSPTSPAADAMDVLKAQMGDPQAAGSLAVPKAKALKKYIQQFDQATLIQMTNLVSAEGASLVETQAHALFGSIKELQMQMQEAVGEGVTSMEDLMQRVQMAVANGKVASVTLTVGTQRRAVLEAVAFGSFLRDVETLVDEEYGLLTAAATGGGFGRGRGGDGPMGAGV